MNKWLIRTAHSNYTITLRDDGKLWLDRKDGRIILYFMKGAAVLKAEFANLNSPGMFRKAPVVGYCVVYKNPISGDEGSTSEILEIKKVE